MSEENIGGEDSLIEERRKKLEILRSENKAYINNFYKENYAADLSTKYSQLTKKRSLRIKTSQIFLLQEELCLEELWVMQALPQ